MNPIIITPRHLLPRLFDSTVSCVAWLTLIALSVSEAPITTLLMAAPPGPVTVLAPAAQTILLYLLIGGANALLMSIWAHYHLWRAPQDRHDTPQPCDIRQLAAHFHVTSSQLSAIQGSRNTTIHHSAHGGINGILLESDPHAGTSAPAQTAPASYRPIREYQLLNGLGHPADLQEARLTHETGTV